MSEQDQHLEPQQGEEDVEAHANKNRNLAKDDDDDVEGHMNLNQNKL